MADSQVPFDNYYQRTLIKAFDLLDGTHSLAVGIAGPNGPLSISTYGFSDGVFPDDLSFPIYNLLFNGDNWDRERTPGMFIRVNAVNVNAEVAIWTPVAGKRFRLMGYHLSATAGGGVLTLRDGVAGVIFASLPLPLNVPQTSPAMQNGYASIAVNNPLRAQAVGTTISGYLFGTEDI